jgi:hypothetical protein
MSDRDYESTSTTEFPREEAWVIHAALLTQIEGVSDSDASAPAELKPLRSLEADGHIEENSLEVVQDALVNHLPSAPFRDDQPGETALRAVADKLGQDGTSVQRIRDESLTFE